MTHEESKVSLFENYNLSGLELKNKTVMAPLTRCRAINNIPNETMATYYSQRASAGLIITEGTSPSPNGLGYARIPGVYSAEQTEGWKTVATQVHKLNGRIFMQLMHTGRVSHLANMPEGAKVLAPSAVKLTQTKMYVDGQGELDIPVAQAMTQEDIDNAIQEYVAAAKNAIAAGFDGVEIHGANGYLIDQFFNPGSNKRTDKYGETIENRTRFAIEVCNAVIDAIGASKVGIRISPYGAMNEMSQFEDTDDLFVYLATQLNRINVSYIHIVDHSSMGAPEVPKGTIQKIRTVFNNTIILAGGYNKASAEKDLRENLGDLIAFGRPFISNPDLPIRLEQDAALADPKPDLFYTPGEEGYIDYPYLKVE